MCELISCKSVHSHHQVSRLKNGFKYWKDFLRVILFIFVKMEPAKISNWDFATFTMSTLSAQSQQHLSSLSLIQNLCIPLVKDSQTIDKVIWDVA